MSADVLRDGALTRFSCFSSGSPAIPLPFSAAVRRLSMVERKLYWKFVLRLVVEASESRCRSIDSSDCFQD
ncbi:hypothetical protein YC2023_019930 [Brassica napus]